MAPITVEQFRRTLTAAAAQRDQDYTHVLQAVSEDAFLHFVVSFKAKSEAEHNLMMLHYAGHGMTKNGNFTFAETTEAKKTLNADNCLLNNLKEADIIPESEHLDVLIILDCCFAHIATRAPTIPRRVVEVIAATSVQTRPARSPPHNTLTAKLAGEIAHRKRSGHKHVEFADAFQALRSRGDIVRPSHTLLVGVASVILPLNGPRTVEPTSIPASYTALFNVSVSQDLTTDEMRQLSAWIRNFHRFASLNIDNVYRTQSMSLIMRSALSVYAKLHRLQGYSLIAENPSAPLDLNRLLTSI
ncbi:hypothetical protein CA14_001805 [Aspergillus flavus]|uniref:Peptidase C14 caspase domain-containing protein n=1 Tax=Aspergillus flavus TaxID=5059 RepID=A0AB74CJM2_ASPFL|nr:hypothetical protein CA14_001805 [Aspergillus flavus]